jgi:hypothetical protein
MQDFSWNTLEQEIIKWDWYFSTFVGTIKIEEK